MVNRQVLERAQELSGNDFEDNVQIASAEFEGLEGIITRDKSGYSDSSVLAYTPAEILTRLGLSREQESE